MIKLELTNFRWHVNANLELNSGKFTLLSGPSGIGKSTFFEAILWVLYNHTDYVHNHSRSEEKTEVILSLNQITVIRSNNPSFLILRDENIEMRNFEAQNQIEKIFGTFSIFQLLNYVAQNERHIFLKLSFQDRLDILTHLLFKGTNPSELLNKLDTKIRETQQKFSIVHGTYEQLSLNFQNLTQSGDVNAKFAIDDNIVREMQIQLETLQNSLNSLRIQRDQLLKYETEKDCYVKMIEDLNKRINDLTTLSPEILQHHENLLISQDIIKMRTSAMDKIVRDGLPSVPPPYFSFEEVTEAIGQFRRNSEMSIKTLSCGIKYDPEIIAIEKKNLLLSIENQGMFPVLENYHRLKKQYDELEKIVDTTVTIEYIRELEAKLHALELTRDVLECPQCNVSLRHISIGLVLSQDGKFDPLFYETTIRELSRARQSMENSHRMSFLAQQINSIEVPTVPLGTRKGDIKALTSKYEQLSKIVYEPLPPIDPNLMQRCHSWHQLFEQKKVALQKINEARNVLMENSGYITRDKIDILREEISLRENLTRQISEIKVKLNNLIRPTVDDLVDLDKRITVESQTFQSVNDNIRKSQISNFALSQYHQLISVRNEVIKEQQRLNDLQELRNRAESLKKEKVENLVKNINEYFDFLAPSMFADSIKIYLDNLLELQIEYKGGNFTDITIMSGGERDRINIILAITFHKLFDSKFLILDESLSNIDLFIKHKVLTILRENLKDKTIIITCHESDNKYYDFVVDI